MRPFAPDLIPNRQIEIEARGARLKGDLVVPNFASGMVVIANGSGSGRWSPRNRAVARALEEAGFATLLLDLLSASEETREQAGGRLRFDVELLAERLLAAVEWLATEPSTRDLPIGILGASTGAAAALIAAAHGPRVRCVVSRGGRPDLAGPWLAAVRAPTRSIVGSADEQVLELNRGALGRLKCEKDVVVVPGATHLFEERGALEEVERLAAEWFARHLRGLEAPARDGGWIDPQGLQRSRGDLEC